MSHTLSVRTGALAALLSSLAWACGETRDVTGVLGANALPAAHASAAARIAVTFTVGPLMLTGIDRQTPDSRLHLQATLHGSVTGDLAGSADVYLDGKLDGPGGSGPVAGTMAISTADGQWQGNLTGEFVGAYPAPGMQLLSRVVLHGDGQQLLTAECDETSATSETLVCTGEILLAHP